MRGNPWLRIGLVVLGIVLMGLPVWRLTRPAAVLAPGSDVVTSAAAKPYSVTVNFAHAPTSFSLTNLSQPVLTGTSPGTAFHADWSVVLPPAGVDLLLKAQWPAGTPRTAVEIKVTTDSGDTRVDQTFWADGPLTELVTVKPAQP